MKSSIRRISLLAALTLMLAVCLLVAAGPVQAWWPMWGDPPLPFGGQQPTIISGGPVGDPFGDPLDPGTWFGDYPHAGEGLLLGWEWFGRYDTATGPWADRFSNCYVLFKSNYIYRADQEGSMSNWGTVIVSSADPTSCWPKLPARSTWLWAGRYQGVVFQANITGLHSLQGEMVGCNRNRGLRTYFTWAFTEIQHADMQAFVVPAWGR